MSDSGDGGVEDQDGGLCEPGDTGKDHGGRAETTDDSSAGASRRGEPDAVSPGAPGGSDADEEWDHPRSDRALARLQSMSDVQTDSTADSPPITVISTTPVSAAAGQTAAATAARPTVPPRPGSDPLRPWWKAKPRQKYPNDWRRIVGGVGWSLISAGVLILLFVVYQLWGTGIQYASAQDDLAKQFAARQAEIAGATTTAPAPTTVAVTAPPTTAASTTASADSSVSTAPAGTTTPPIDAPTTAPAATAAVAPYSGPAIQLGDAIGRLTIPKISVDAIVLAGVRTQDIAKGIGHFPDTPLPGQQGNAALAGHRTTHGGVFGDLDQLVAGDEIDFTTLTNVTYTYIVTGSTVVQPDQVEVLADHPDKVMLTLATCTPKFTAKSRLIVTAELKVGGEPPVQSATKQYGNPGLYANGADTNDTSGSLGPDEGGTTTAVATTAGTATATGTGATTAPTAAPVAVAPANSSFDALNEGWFSDSGAYLPVVLWGLGLIAVALLARALSRKTRRLVGWAVAFAPLMVLLYFWFENVNRLMPPNL